MNGLQAMAVLIAAIDVIGYGTREYFLTQRHDSSNQVTLVENSTSAVNDAYKNTWEYIKPVKKPNRAN